MANLQYVGARYVPKYYENPDDGSADWKDGVEYEALTMVIYNGNVYTSRQNVPATVGNPPNNLNYWAKTFDSSSAPVTGVKGSAEDSYRVGNVSVSPENLGLADVATSGSYNDLSDVPGNATTASDGFMSAAQATKLAGIETGAQVNSSANIAIKNVEDTTLGSFNLNDTRSSSIVIPNATTSTPGFMSAADKAQLSAIYNLSARIDSSFSSDEDTSITLVDSSHKRITTPVIGLLRISVIPNITEGAIIIRGNNTNYSYAYLNMTDRQVSDALIPQTTLLWYYNVSKFEIAADTALVFLYSTSLNGQIGLEFTPLYTNETDVYLFYERVSS